MVDIHALHYVNMTMFKLTVNFMTVNSNVQDLIQDIQDMYNQISH